MMDLVFMQSSVLYVALPFLWPILICSHCCHVTSFCVLIWNLFFWIRSRSYFVTPHIGHLRCTHFFLGRSCYTFFKRDVTSHIMFFKHDVTSSFLKRDVTSSEVPFLKRDVTSSEVLFLKRDVTSWLSFLNGHQVTSIASAWLWGIPFIPQAINASLLFPKFVQYSHLAPHSGVSCTVRIFLGFSLSNVFSATILLCWHFLTYTA